MKMPKTKNRDMKYLYGEVTEQVDAAFDEGEAELEAVEEYLQDHIMYLMEGYNVRDLLEMAADAWTNLSRHEKEAFGYGNNDVRELLSHMIEVYLIELGMEYAQSRR